MNFEIDGVLHKLYDIESKTASFQTREFVIATDGQYPQYVKFQAVQDRCTILDGYKEGERIKVSFDLRGREWQGKYFTNLNAWKVDKVSAAPAASSNAGADSSFPTGNFEPFGGSNQDSGFNDYGDLPF
ncbi:MAG: hypothetical protein RLZZ546_847 [Bacteroidota bacterium]|jgi:hypothetical protein